MGQLDGKVALVTGGTSGMGAVTAKALAAEGAQVVISGRNADRGKAVVADIEQAGGEAALVLADVTKESDVANLVAETVERYGKLDVAFNNAGGASAYGPLDTLNVDDFAAVVHSNLVGTFLCLKYEVPAMREHGGSIINNASTAGVVGNAFGLSAYTSAKHGVVGLTRSAALEFGKHDIRVNALITGPIATEEFRTRLAKQPGAMAQAGNSTALRRVGEEHEIASFVTFLATDGARFITGALLPIDGGATAGTRSAPEQKQQ